MEDLGLEKVQCLIPKKKKKKEEERNGCSHRVRDALAECSCFRGAAGAYRLGVVLCSAGHRAEEFTVLGHF